MEIEKVSWFSVDWVGDRNEWNRRSSLSRWTEINNIVNSIFDFTETVSTSAPLILSPNHNNRHWLSELRRIFFSFDMSSYYCRKFTRIKCYILMIFINPTPIKTSGHLILSVVHYLSVFARLLFQFPKKKLSSI